MHCASHPRSVLPDISPSRGKIGGRTEGRAKSLTLVWTTPFPAIRLSLSLLALLLTPVPAFAHASERGYVLLLPTGYYLVSGAIAVAASFVALLAVQRRPLEKLAAWRLPLVSIPEGLRSWTGLASFLVLAALIAAGTFGSRDPLSNPLPLVVWTLLWVGLTLVQGFFGNLWHWLDPWYAPVRLARAVLPAPRAYPERLGYWPAVMLFGGFAWFELIDVAPDDPFRLAIAAGGYWLFTFSAMLVFGHDAWSRQGEFLSVFFRLVSRLGILDARETEKGRRLSICLPAAKLWRESPLPLSGTLLLLAVLASVSFDGLSKTFLWLGTNGINPLEFPGRSAMQGINGAGLLMTFAALSALFLICVAIGRRLVGKGRSVEAAGLLVWSIVPIALAYHFSHYLTALLVNGQYALVALSDPFGLGWNLFGTAYWPVSAGVVMGYEQARLVWNLQAFAIIGGHVLAVALAHGLAWRLSGGSGRAGLSQVPLTLLMIGYTVFGLWLLSTPTAG
jgi:hypothetical protein